MRQFAETLILQATYSIFSNLACKVAYIEGIKYVKLIEIHPVVIEIRCVENSNLAAPVINTLVCCTSFLAADTRLCVLINETFADSTANNWKFDAIYRKYIAYTEGEIIEVM